MGYHGGLLNVVEWNDMENGFTWDMEDFSILDTEVHGKENDMTWK